MRQPTTDGTLPPVLSEAQWAALPADEPGEVVDGRLVAEEEPDLTHETVVSWLICVLHSCLVSRGGFVFGSEAKFIVAPRRGRKPDVTAYFPGGPALPRRGAVRVPPDIAVQVVSQEAKDVGCPD
jgi:Uma2 family endonuclease